MLQQQIQQQTSMASQLAGNQMSNNPLAVISKLLHAFDSHSAQMTSAMQATSQSDRQAMMVQYAQQVGSEDCNRSTFRSRCSYNMHASADDADADADDDDTDANDEWNDTRLR
eukprot:747659-Hanusia_phi.AAC.1